MTSASRMIRASSERRVRLPEHHQTLRVHSCREHRDAGDIPARLAQAWNQPQRERVAAADKHDRDRLPRQRSGVALREGLARRFRGARMLFPIPTFAVALFTPILQAAFIPPPLRPLFGSRRIDDRRGTDMGQVAALRRCERGVTPVLDLLRFGKPADRLVAFLMRRWAPPIMAALVSASTAGLRSSECSSSRERLPVSMRLRTGDG